MIQEKKYIIYGAGKKGRSYLQFLQKYNLDNSIKYFCDKNAECIGNIGSIPVLSYEEAADKGLPFIIAIRNELVEEVVNQVQNDNQVFYSGLDKVIVDELRFMSRLEYEREICAISHIDTMDSYFDIAESKGALEFFWSEGSICYELFRRLDLKNTVELACGRGRHVPHYLSEAEHVTLVDILEKNVEICKQRFSDIDKISYVVNNGYDLRNLSDNQYTSLFTYDSMVHFELLDIANYLKEVYRILKPGGRALFHHSNNDSDYKASYDSARESRSFMSKNVFAYLAYRAGFEIEEQRVVDWIEPKLDCLTLVVKR